MIRLWPRSLFGRLSLVLATGLILAQLISAAITLSERDEALFHFSDAQWAQRIAQTVRLMDSLDGPERQRIASIVTTPRLLVSLSKDPPVQGEPDPQSEDYLASLKELFGDTHEVRVVHAERTPQEAVAGVPATLDAPRVARSEHVITQVRLTDGSWVSFDHPRPWSVGQRPYRMLYGLAVLLGAVLLLSFLAVRRLTRPLSLLANAADALGRDLDRPPLPEQGPLEVRAAIAAFNTMQARLRDYIYERTRILTAVSHDLRTPITRLRLRAELLGDEALKTKFVHDLQEMESMTSATLAFLRGFEEREAVQSVDVMALLESLQTDSLDMGYDVKLEGRLERPVLLRPRALRRCLDNLVTNAVRYGGGMVTVSVEAKGRGAMICVRDRGPGIPAAELEKVFEPYYRLEGARSREGGGTGLGLSIARNIAELHGGSLLLRNHPEGGLEAVLTLPGTQES
ncbi:MAG TPA: ATP-binding protein [Gammaproteobacteria bacterium]|nr:ATP-binding protein [Gammaproteobacteria bacterium]